MHGGAFTVYSGIRAISFNNKAQGALRVSMTGGNLAWQDQLQACVERLRNGRLTAQSGIF
jgi:hypothetical protein